jgi:signal transduction histidine kinase
MQKNLHYLYYFQSRNHCYHFQNQHFHYPADLTTLITNILQISKLDNNQIQVKPEAFNLSEELIQYILGFEVPLDEKNIDLEIDVPDNIEIERDSGINEKKRLKYNS